jgi:AraC family transcriptional regulator
VSDAVAVRSMQGTSVAAEPRLGDWRAKGQSARAQLLESNVALVEDFRSRGVPLRKNPELFSADFQICLPYRGLFVWHVGDDNVVGDANQVLFVTGGESYHLSQPLADNYAELIITPNPDLLAELADGCETSLSRHPLFRRRHRRADHGLQLLRTRFLQRAHGGSWNGLAAEECVISLLRSALASETVDPPPSRSTRRLIGRAKEFLEANFSSPIRLADVAQAVGASPAYLTDVFRRAEGVPLHRYLTQLRLARALVELQQGHDLTTLALAIGFSSHSHFSAVFRRAFGCTPSQFRESARKAVDVQRPSATIGATPAAFRAGR